MATRTFIGDGASHNWSATGAWVEGIVPTAADDVVFSSNTAGSILVIDGTSASPSLCKSIDTTNYTRTITFAASKQLNVGGSTSGAFKMTAGMTFAPATSSLVKFVSTTTGNNITHGGYTFGNMTYDGVGGGWTWQDANSMAGGGGVTLNLTNGALDTNSKGTPAGGIEFLSSNTNTRSLTLGTTNFNAWKGFGNAWNISTSTGMTLSAASSTITLVTTGNNNTFAGGGLTYGTLTSTVITTATVTISGANTFGTLTLGVASGGPPNTTTGYFLSNDQTVTGTLTSTGNSLIIRNFIASDTIGTPRTLSAGTFTITNTDLRDITKAGAGSGDISATSSTSGNGDCGGNSGWTFASPKNCYMKTAVSVNWSANNWFTTSGGSTAATPTVPLIHDTAIFDVNSVTAGSKTITLNMPRVPSFNWTGVANTPAFATSTAFESYGSIILVSGMTHTGAVTVGLMGRGSNTLDGGGLTWPANSTIEPNCGSGTYSLTSNLTIGSGGAIFNTGSHSGTLALNGFNLTMSGASSINIDGGTVSGTGAITIGTGGLTVSGGTLSLGGTLTSGAAGITLSSGTLTMNGNNITGHTTLAVSGGTLNLSGQINGSNTITVSGGTINNTGSAGELKTSGNTAITFSGGTSTVKKITMGGTSNIVVSGTGNLTIPAGGSATWSSGLFDVTGNTATLTIDGIPSFTNGALSVTGRSINV